MSKIRNTTSKPLDKRKRRSKLWELLWSNKRSPSQAASWYLVELRAAYLYFTEQDTRNRRNLRYTFSDYDSQEIDKILKSADAEDSEAQFLTENIYESGVAGIIKADITKTLAYWEKSAISGNIAAQICLADLYKSGTYVEQNFQGSRVD